MTQEKSAFELTTERLKAQAQHHLQNKNPRPELTLKHYVAMSLDRTVPAKERALWRQMADELEAHIEANRPLSLEELRATHDPLF
jgi:hypothetical protein